MYKFKKNDIYPTSTLSGPPLRVVGDPPSLATRLDDSANVHVGYSSEGNSNIVRNKSGKLSNILIDKFFRCTDKKKPNSDTRQVIENMYVRSEVSCIEAKPNFHVKGNIDLGHSKQIQSDTSSYYTESNVPKVTDTPMSRVGPLSDTMSDDQLFYQSNEFVECNAEDLRINEFSDVVREKKAEKQRLYRRNRTPEQKMHERYLARERKRRQRERERNLQATFDIVPNHSVPRPQYL